MRLLEISDEARAKIARVIAHAEKHHFYPGLTSAVPGNDERFVALLNSYRCVFTFSHADKRIYRHLTISVPGTKYPSPEAAFTIAEMFGFTGFNEEKRGFPGKDWYINVNDKERCVVILQPMALEKGAKHDA